MDMNGENMKKKNNLDNVEFPQPIEQLFGIKDKEEATLQDRKEFEYGYLNRNTDLKESMMCAITRSLETAWNDGTDVVALCLNSDDFIQFMAETSFQEDFTQSICAKLYAGTMHQVFSMKIVQTNEDQSLVLLGNRDEFDYEKFKKDNDIVDNN